MSIMYIAAMQERLQVIKQQHQWITEELKTYPQGKLSVTRNSKWEKWYIKQADKPRIYLPKSERSLAEKMAYKRYLQEKEAELENEQKALEAYLAIRSGSPDAQALYSPEQSIHKLLPKHTYENEKINQWYESAYITNEKYPENKRHPSISGNILRSKSELLIDEFLYRNNIPFHYEEQLVLGDGTIFYPDFKVYSVKFHRFMYWEHLGMMDDKEYVEAAIAKIATYLKNNMIIGRDLIVTVESLKAPLTYPQIRMAIENYLLA
ncbi:MAG: hypothetical protein E7277_02055 [Lachnospiraceae bacterium]|nr:hypothetical protein [Lachnospiraceae bacterium]